MVNAARSQVPGLWPAQDSPPVAWRVEPGLTPYPAALTVMEARSAAIAAGAADELVWLVEHPPLFTAGTSAKPQDLRFAGPGGGWPVYEAGRGGQYTYHGPGQRVVYLMLDLKRRSPDVRRFVSALEAWIIATLDAFGVVGETRADRIGVWVRRPERGDGAEDKIAAIGIRLRRWVSLHGISLNVAPELSHFGGIVPCGITDPRYGVTSLRALGHDVGLAQVDSALRAAFGPLFGPTRESMAPPPELS